MTKAITHRKYNSFIAYLKGWAIVSIIMIHLLDWSNTELTKAEQLWREPLNFGVMFFVALSGSVIYVAYNRYDDFKIYFKKLWFRAGELFLVYFVYNLIKLLVFDFQKEPFYWQFSEKGTFNWQNILGLHSFSVPITILLTIGALLLFSPFLLWLTKKLKFSKLAVLFLIGLLFVINYSFVLPSNWLTDFLYSKNLVLFPILYWAIPFLIGFFLAMVGFEKHKGKCLLIFGALTIGAYYFYYLTAWQFSYYMYPLRPYYVFAGFTFAYILIFLFSILEKIKLRGVEWFLHAIKLLGDHTLFIYVVHWIIIDLTIWWYYPNIKMIKFYVPIFLGLYLIKNYRAIVYKK